MENWEAKLLVRMEISLATVSLQDALVKVGLFSPSNVGY